LADEEEEEVFQVNSGYNHVSLNRLERGGLAEDALEVGGWKEGVIYKL
jgi:hypothetical protein